MDWAVGFRKLSQLGIRLAILGVLKGICTPFEDVRLRSKSFDFLLAASAGWWSLQTLWRMASAGITFAGVLVAAIHALVAWAFITRYPPRNLVASHDFVAALPSLAISGMVSQLAGPPSVWPWFCQALFTCGALITVISICHLGQSFAVLPHDRPLVTSGAYRYIRHPIYLGETLMLLSCCTTQTKCGALPLMILSLTAIAIRINVEESKLLLSNSQSFNDYTSQVRWRLVPFVW